jgi:hypothetical protein
MFCRLMTVRRIRHALVLSFCSLGVANAAVSAAPAALPASTTALAGCSPAEKAEVLAWLIRLK